MTPRLLVEGLWGLFLLGMATRFRLRGPYWAWRTQTAFPNGSPAGGRAELVRLALEYGAWSWRTRRLR
ncbi:MAG: hypothetical protein AB8F26_09525 [Phycisphaerales bacterium]